MIAGYENYIHLFFTIPGIDRKSAIPIISEIGIDMSQFSSHYKLVSLAGLSLVAINQLAKSNLLRFQELVYTLNLVLFKLHMQLLKINIVARKELSLPLPEKIIVAIYHMLETGEVFNPRDISNLEASQKNALKILKTILKTLIINYYVLN